MTKLTHATSTPQTRKGSFAESAVNVVAGFALAILVQRLVYPLFGIATTFAEDGLIALIFTATSLVRSFAIRRLFVMVEQQRERDRQQRQASLERRLSMRRT